MSIGRFLAPSLAAALTLALFGGYHHLLAPQWIELLGYSELLLLRDIPPELWFRMLFNLMIVNLPGYVLLLLAGLVMARLTRTCLPLLAGILPAYVFHQEILAVLEHGYWWHPVSDFLIVKAALLPGIVSVVAVVWAAGRTSPPPFVPGFPVTVSPIGEHGPNPGASPEMASHRRASARSETTEQNGST